MPDTQYAQKEPYRNYVYNIAKYTLLAVVVHAEILAAKKKLNETVWLLKAMLNKRKNDVMPHE